MVAQNIDAVHGPESQLAKGGIDVEDLLHDKDLKGPLQRALHEHIKEIVFENEYLLEMGSPLDRRNEREEEQLEDDGISNQEELLLTLLSPVSDRTQKVLAGDDDREFDLLQNLSDLSVEYESSLLSTDPEVTLSDDDDDNDNGDSVVRK